VHSLTDEYSLLPYVRENSPKKTGHCREYQMHIETLNGAYESVFPKQWCILPV